MPSPVRRAVIVLIPAVLVPAGWCAADPPAGAGALAPNLTRIDQVAMLSWLEPAGPVPEAGPVAYRLRLATFSGGAWGPPSTIVESSDFFANWADVPSVARAGDGSLIAHWPQKSGHGTYAYDVMLARSRDGGTSWAVLGALHDDRTETEHGFVSMVPEAGGVRVFWLDGRAMVPATGGGEPGAMALRTALIGQSIGGGTVLDARVCECCATSAALTDDGPVVVYRDRGPEEVRDIAIIRRAGEGWTRPRTVHDDGWLMAACPVNGPAVAARGLLVVVAWFTGAVEHGIIRAAFSRDGGASFDEPVTIDRSWPLGRVDVVLDDDGRAIVSWLGSAPGGAAIKLAGVTPEGLGQVIQLAAAGSSRTTGFPRVTLLGSTLLVVWTEEGAETRLRSETLRASLGGP